LVFFLFIHNTRSRIIVICIRITDYKWGFWVFAFCYRSTMLLLFGFVLWVVIYNIYEFIIYLLFTQIDYWQLYLGTLIIPAVLSKSITTWTSILSSKNPRNYFHLIVIYLEKPMIHVGIHVLSICSHQQWLVDDWMRFPHLNLIENKNVNIIKHWLYYCMHYFLLNFPL